jgi:hypothetical protein
MHDPCTVAFDIKYPWWKYRPWPKAKRHYRGTCSPGHEYMWNRLTDAEKKGRASHWVDGYRDTFATIWHVDPERDGSDDSCGWSFPKLTGEQWERLRNVAWSEGRNPYFLRCRDKEWIGTRAEAESLYRGLVLLVADVLGIPCTYDEAARHAARYIHDPDCSDPARVFCYLPGYHTNFPDDETDGPPYSGATAERRREHFAGVLAGVAVTLLRKRRSWWRHPKWHVWHWRVQIHPLQQFKRWAFSRCATCGRGFSWGYAPVCGQWDGDGPRWFRGERNVHHHLCHRAGMTPQGPSAEAMTA